MSKTQNPYISIDGKKIGSTFQPYFIAEAGLNHNGDINLAKKMIDAALDCGADAIKFQTYISENFLTSSSEYFKFFKDMELKPEEFGELYDHAKERGITFFSAPFDIESANNLKKMNVPCFKIASSDLTNFPLIKHVAKMQIPMIISTGLGNLQEVQDVVDICKSVNNENIALLHCVANYPAQLDETNLQAMRTLRDKFDVPVGYSDNGESSLVDIVAVSLGANLIEKHFTLDRKMKGPDQKLSADPKEFLDLVKRIRSVEKLRGKPRDGPTKTEKKSLKLMRKSIAANTDIPKGSKVTKSMVIFVRPGTGISPKDLDKIIGKRIKKNVQKGNLLNWKMF